MTAGIDDLGALLVRSGDRVERIVAGEVCGCDVLRPKALMLLAIDVGNTNIVLGVFDGATLVQSWRLQTLRERTSDELGLLVDGLFAHSRDRARADPRRRPRVGRAAADGHDRARWSQRYFGVTALVVEPGVNTGMPILYENPAEVGADRIVNAVAAFEKFGKAARQAAHRRRLRHGDDARCDYGEGRIPGRRDLSRA